MAPLHDFFLGFLPPSFAPRRSALLYAIGALAWDEGGRSLPRRPALLPRSGHETRIEEDYGRYQALSSANEAAGCRIVRTQDTE